MLSIFIYNKAVEYVKKKSFDRIYLAVFYQILPRLKKRVLNKISRTKVYTATTTVPEVFTSASGTHVNLITCTGAWNATKKSYAERFVVFADIVL